MPPKVYTARLARACPSLSIEKSRRCTGRVPQEWSGLTSFRARPPTRIVHNILHQLVEIRMKTAKAPNPASLLLKSPHCQRQKPTRHQQQCPSYSQGYVEDCKLALRAVHLAQEAPNGHAIPKSVAAARREVAKRGTANKVLRTRSVNQPSVQPMAYDFTMKNVRSRVRAHNGPSHSWDDQVPSVPSKRSRRATGGSQGWVVARTSTQGG